MEPSGYVSIASRRVPFKIKVMLKHDEFSWNEAFSNNQGKTSIVLVTGFVLCIVGCISLAVSIWLRYNDGILGSITFTTLGSGLFGIRRFTPEKDVKIIQNESSENSSVSGAQ